MQPSRSQPPFVVLAVLAWSLGSGALSAPAPAPAGADARGAADIVVVAEPTASDALGPGRSGPVTLAYRVVEVFSGEVGSASLVVRHDDLGDEDRARLASGERVILLARRDPSVEGRHVAPAPLRATPSALAAFRKWSAPADVRSPRPVEEVVAEVASATEPAAPAPRPGVEPATKAEPDTVAGPATPAVAPWPDVDEEFLAPRRETEARVASPPPRMDPAPVVVASRDAGAVASRDAGAVASRDAGAVASRDAGTMASGRARTTGSREDGWDPPILIGADVQPAQGPGLPPEPAADALGPETSRRPDLRPPPPPRRHRSR